MDGRSLGRIRILFFSSLASFHPFPDECLWLVENFHLLFILHPSSPPSQKSSFVIVLLLLH